MSDCYGFDAYQRWTRTTAVYPRTTSVMFAYLALGLNGEAGEVAEHYKKVLRGDAVCSDKQAVVKELGDVLWYLARLADELGFNLSEVARVNQDKLNSRKDRGVLKGSGDDR